MTSSNWDVATPHGDFVAPARECSPCTGDIDIHTCDAMTGSDQKWYHAPADEACAAHYHDGHAFPPRCCAPLGLNEGATLPVDGGARKWSEMRSRAALRPRRRRLPRTIQRRSVALPGAV